MSDFSASLQIGKTSFALSLFGISNHCRGHWSPKDWNCDADYMIIDDVPWDGFEKDRGFPDKRDFLTGQDGLFVSIHVASCQIEPRLPSCSFSY